MMRQLLWCIALGSIGVTTSGLAGEQGMEETAAELRVMTFNVRYNNPNDGPDAWPARKDMVADIIRRHADIAGLQEARSGQIQDLQERLPEFGWYGVGRDDGEQAGEYCPIFYRRDRFELLDSQTRWLSETPRVPGSKSWDAAITRLVTIGRFRETKHDVEFRVMNTHFDHVGATARKKSAELIRQHVEQGDHEVPVIVTGDFNCTPSERPYQILTARDAAVRLLDSREVSQHAPEGPDSTWCGFREVVPGRRIDFIFVTPAVEVLRHRTLDDQIGGRFPSDHLPVVARLSIDR
jgi:endonuclease/exonuclease/phosphatase family metal-dependent hydrolase